MTVSIRYWNYGVGTTTGRGKTRLIGVTTGMKEKIEVISNIFLTLFVIYLVALDLVLFV